MKKFEVKLELLIQLLWRASLIGVVLGSMFFIGYRIGKGQSFIPNDNNEQIIQLTELRPKVGKLKDHFNGVPPLSMEHHFDSSILKDKLGAKSLQKNPAPIQLLDKQQAGQRNIINNQNRPGKMHKPNQSGKVFGNHVK